MTRFNPWAKYVAECQKINKGIVAKYLEGKDQVELATEYGVSRQRIQQILKRYGVSRKDGGIHKQVTPKKMADAKESAEKAEAKCMRIYGCDRVTFKRLSLGMRRSDKQSPMQRFENQRNAANHRKIEWEMTFAQWMTIWLDSGKWEQRGLGIGK